MELIMKYPKLSTTNLCLYQKQTNVNCNTMLQYKVS